MKLCMSTLPCPEADANALVRLCQEHGLSAVEFRLNNNGELYNGANDPHEVGRVMSETGIAVTDVASGVCIKRWDDMVLMQLHEAIDTAAAVGAMAVRVFLGNSPDRKSEICEELDENGIVRMLREGCDYGAGCGIRIWIETHGEYSKGMEVAELIKRVDRTNIGVIWDVMNSLSTGESVEDTFFPLKELIEHVHIKDGKPYEDDDDMLVWYFTRIGEGIVPIEKVVKLLDGIGYDGWCSLEWEPVWRKELRHLPNDMDWVLSDFIKGMKF